MASMRRELISNDELIARLRSEVHGVSSGRASVPPLLLNTSHFEGAEASGEVAALQRELAASRAQLEALTSEVLCSSSAATDLNSNFRHCRIFC